MAKFAKTIRKRTQIISNHSLARSINTIQITTKIQPTQHSNPPIGIKITIQLLYQNLPINHNSLKVRVCFNFWLHEPTQR